MGYRLSKIYTKTGDDGTTGLGDGSRVSKDDLRVQAYGEVDELNSSIGLLLAHNNLSHSTSAQLGQIQQDLFNLGAELCIPGTCTLTADHSHYLEQWLDEYNENLKPLKEFILPGGSIEAAHCQVARTICRRAERIMVTLHQRNPLNAYSLHYINRLSDYLFVLARHLNRLANIEEPLWQSQRIKRRTSDKS